MQFYAAWDVPYGAFALELDPLSAWFLASALALAAVAAVFGGRLLLEYRDRKWLGPPWFFFNLLVAGMTLVLVVATACSFWWPGK